MSEVKCPHCGSGNVQYNRWNGGRDEYRCLGPRCPGDGYFTIAIIKTRAEREAAQEHELFLNYERRCQAHDEFLSETIKRLKRWTEVPEINEDKPGVEDALKEELARMEKHVKHVQGLR